jgi:hypothetical protein
MRAKLLLVWRTWHLRSNIIFSESVSSFSPIWLLFLMSKSGLCLSTMATPPSQYLLIVFLFCYFLFLAHLHPSRSLHPSVGTLLHWCIMFKIALNSCIIYVIGVHRVSVTVLYFVWTQQCQLTCSRLVWGLIFCTNVYCKYLQLMLLYQSCNHAFYY